ncbi:hypothetical protein PspLS_07417 [Pyricularia sp. CBS 133598]|nr:hypothetical protein PspLS_07417 [Pyricularia sp. CBS 133598]
MNDFTRKVTVPLESIEGWYTVVPGKEVAQYTENKPHYKARELPTAYRQCWTMQFQELSAYMFGG